MKEIFLNTYINSKLVSKDEKAKLIQYLKGEGCIYTRKSKNISGLNCTRKDDNERLNIVFNNLETIFEGCSILEYVERYDVNRNYKYSAIFKIKDYEAKKDMIQQNISENVEKIWELEDLSKYINSNDPELLVMEDNLEYTVMKLNYIIGNVNNTMNIKYPVLCIIFKELGIIEIRLTGLNNQFKKIDNIYKYYFDSVIRKITSRLKFEIGYINFRQISRRILEEKRDNVTVYSQWMEGEFGSHARLRVAEDGDHYMLPILGQLEKFIEENDILKNNEDAKGAIRVFIDKVNSEHDFVRRAICWLNDDNNIDYVVDFIHEYKGSQYSVLQNYFNNHDMEDMNDVTRNIISYER